MSDFLAQGVFDQTLNQLVSFAAIRHYAAERGMVVSEEMVDRAIANIPDFRNFAGQFDQNAFRQLLASQNMTEAWFREDIRGADAAAAAARPHRARRPGAAGCGARICEPAVRTAAGQRRRGSGFGLRRRDQPERRRARCLLPAR